jgi:hypothetical protein
MSTPVWELMVYINEDSVRRTFSARTNMTWEDFVSMAKKQFDRSHDEVRLGYCVSGGARTMSDLTCESHWDMALVHIRERIQAARTRAVTMEIKDLVSCTGRYPQL